MYTSIISGALFSCSYVLLQFHRRLYFFRCSPAAYVMFCVVRTHKRYFIINLKLCASAHKPCIPFNVLRFLFFFSSSSSFWRWKLRVVYNISIAEKHAFILTYIIDKFTIFQSCEAVLLQNPRGTLFAYYFRFKFHAASNTRCTMNLFRIYATFTIFHLTPNI